MPMQHNAIEDMYPVSTTQHGMLFHSLYDPEGGVYVEQQHCTIQGGLQLEAFEQAWQQVINRHAILRTAFMWEDLDEPIQVVHRRVTPPIEQVDWRDLVPAEQESAFQQLLISERRRGFPLGKAPLLRLVLCRIADDTYKLIFSSHHLLLDGWCLSLVLREFFTYYEASSSGREVRLPRPRPYRDYIAWLKRQDHAQAEGFWREMLKGFTAPTPLRVERTTPPSEEQAGSYESQQRMLSAETTTALQAFARQQRVTLNTVVQGAWALLLSHYSGERDVVFGMTVAGRPPQLAGVETMIGLFINTLPLRVEVTPDAAIREWLQALQQRQLELRQYEYSPLSQVQKWSDMPGGTSLFDSIVVFENYPAHQLSQDVAQSLGGVPAQLAIRDVGTVEPTNYPLTVQVIPGAGLGLRIGYEPSRFEPQTIERMVGHFQMILEQIVARPDARLADISLLTSAERQQLQSWNATGAPAIDARSVPQVFEDQVARTPDAAALIFGAVEVSYQELNQRASRLAQYLQSLGVGGLTQGEVRVGICMERSIEQVTAVLGVLKAGGAYVPLDPAYPAERLAFMLADAGVSVLLTIERLLRVLPATTAQTVCLDTSWPAIAQVPASDPPRRVYSDGVVYITYTSGSTGTPKGIAMTHRALLNLLGWQMRHHSLPLGARTLQFASLSFDVSFQDMFSTWAAGGTVVSITEEQRRDVINLASVLAEQQIQRLFIPAVALQQVAEGFRAEEHGGLRLRQIISGSEQLQLTPAITAMLRQLPACRLHNEYGPSETHVVTALALPQATFDWPRRPAIGRPIDNTQIYILDRRMEPLPIGVPGELFIGGVQLARGYMNRPDLTADKFIPDRFGAQPGGRLYRTGDLARYLPDGNIEFLGRIDNQVKIRGFRVEPGEVETVLGQHPEVHESVVVARADGDGHQRLVAYVVPAELPGPTTTDLREFLRQRLPDYLVPSFFVVLERLPLTPNGKVDRKALPAPDGARPELRQAFAGPQTEVEQTLAAIWSQVTGVAQVGIHDNFFELGGDSILSMQVVSRAGQAGIRLSVKDIFEYQTIAELASVVVAGSGAEAEQGLVTGPVPLTPIQHWFFQKISADRHHWNMDVLLATQPGVDPQLLNEIIQHLAVHHDALRLCYTQANGTWQQHNAEPGAAVPFSIVDLSDLPPGEQIVAVQRAATELQISMILDQPPLFRAAFFNLGAERPGRLFMVMHHLIIDAFSWRVLLEDMQTAYQQLSAGQPIQLPPKTTSYRYWAERQIAHADSEALRQELPYWLSFEHAPFTPLPRDVPDAENTVASTQILPIWFSPEETRALLQDVPKTYNARMNEVILAATGYAVARWTGSSAVQINVEGHGREELFDDVDMTRTVGWCPSISPIHLDLHGAGTPAETLIRARDQIRQIPQRGVGYGMLRYLSQDQQIRQRLAALPEAEVMVNYFGQFDQVVANSSIFQHMVAEPTGPIGSANGLRFTVLFIVGQIIQGQLSIHFHYSANLHHRSTIQRFADDFQHMMRSLIAAAPADGAERPAEIGDMTVPAEPL